MGRVLFRWVDEQLCIATFVQSRLLPYPLTQPLTSIEPLLKLEEEYTVHCVRTMSLGLEKMLLSFFVEIYPNSANILSHRKIMDDQRQQEKKSKNQ